MKPGKERQTPRRLRPTHCVWLATVAVATAVVALLQVPVSGASTSPATSAGNPSATSIDLAASALSAKLEQTAPDVFAGLWVGADNVVHVALTTETSAAQLTLSSFPYASNLSTSIGAPYSEATLNSLVSQFTSDIPRWEAAGVDVSTIAPDVKSDSVVIGLASPLSDTASQALAIDTAGSPVRTEVSGAIGDTVCNRTACYPQLQGGLAILDTSGFECTSGAIVHSPNTNVNAAGDELLTAGHCFTLNDTVVQGGVFLGTVVSRAYGGNVDAEAVSISSLWGWAPQICAYTTGPCSQTVAYAANPAVGWPDCLSGITTGYHCGQVTATNVTVNITGGPTITGMVMDNLCSLPGDSGGPHLDGTSVYLEGVQTGSNYQVVNGNNVCNPNPNSVYSPAPTDLAATGTNMN